jgi:type IV pilus assembly protein PilF
MTLLAACTSEVTNSEQITQPNAQQRAVAAAKINTQLGLAYLNQGQLPLAKQKLLLAMQQNPDSITVMDAMAYFWETTGNQNLALKNYQRAVALAPTSGRALNNYGAYLCRKGQYQLAEKYLLAAANEPRYIDSGAAFENAGLCAMAIPDDEMAGKYFIQAIEQDHNRPVSYFELARLYYKRSQYNLAKKYLKGYEDVAQQTANSLWLGIEIANKTKDVATILKNGALLEKKFAKSKQYQFYQKMQLS